MNSQGSIFPEARSFHPLPSAARVPMLCSLSGDLVAAMLDVIVGMGGRWWDTVAQRGLSGEDARRGENQCKLLQGEKLCKWSSALICFINLKWQSFNPNMESFFLLPREPFRVSSVLCAVRHVIQPYSCVGSSDPWH